MNKTDIFHQNKNREDCIEIIVKNIENHKTGQLCWLNRVNRRQEIELTDWASKYVKFKSSAIYNLDSHINGSLIKITVL